jgi:hypothetical protein
MKHWAMIALASIALASGQARAAAYPAFDLACQSRSGEALKFRFDLAQRKWCIAPCQAVWGIDQVSDGSIRVLTYGSDSRYNWTIVINRYTSTFAAVHRGYGNDPADSGSCKAGPFSGFPRKEF